MQNYWLKPSLIPFMSNAVMNYYEFDSIEPAYPFDPLLQVSTFAERTEVLLYQSKIPGNAHELEIIYKQSDLNLLDSIDYLLVSGGLEMQAPILRKKIEYGLVKNGKWLSFTFPEISMHYERGTSVIRVWGFFKEFDYDYASGWVI